MKFTKEVKTGLLALVAIALLIFGYSFLNGKNLLSDDRIFYSVYDNVQGLSPSSSVTINGLEVGKVTAIDFVDKKGNLVVTFTVKSKFDFSENSTAQIYGGGLIGGKSLEILPALDNGQRAESGDTLAGTIDEGIFELVNERLTPLQKKVEKVIAQTDSVLGGVNDVMNKDTRMNLRTAIENISNTAYNFNKASQSLSGLLAENRTKLSRTFTNLDEMSANVNKISDSLSQLNIGELVSNMEHVVSDFREVSSKLAEGRGSAGKLLNDDELYDNLARATKQMEELMQDIKLNPKRYVHFSVFGKRPGPYDEPKDSLR